MQNQSRRQVSGPKTPGIDGAACESMGVLTGCSGHAVTVEGVEGRQAAMLLKRDLERREAIPLSLFAFGGDGANEEVAAEFAGYEMGISRLRGDGGAAGGPVVMQMFAIAGVSATRVIRRGKSVGVVYEDEFTRSCRLSAVVPASRDASREEQTLEVMEAAEAMLDEGGFGFRDTVRTWFYLDHLLEWYDGFNAVRNEFFRKRGIHDGMVPASTGIGAANGSGAALTCDLLAIQAKQARVSLGAVPSPLQDSALKYRSSFSRAVEISRPGLRQLLVSGTASINREGRTIHAGDPVAQVGFTVEVVDALLRSREMGWADVTRGIAYFKRVEDIPLLGRCFHEKGIPAPRLAVVQADICRADLDFEIEVDAVRA